jgi:phage tail protein X
MDRPETGAVVPSVPPSSDVLTVPTASRWPERAVAVVTMQKGDTLPWLLHNVYGRTDNTVVDAVQFANPGVNSADLLKSGQRLYLPPVEAAAMVYQLADRRYVVHLLTTSDPTDLRFRRLSADIAASGRKVRLVPVRLWTGCEACFRVWVGEFSSRGEAEAFYRHARPENAA